MPKLILDIETCRQCPYITRMLDESLDGWDRPEIWSCNKSGGRKIQEYVEWHDTVEVPKWCPLHPQGPLAVLMKLQE